MDSIHRDRIRRNYDSLVNETSYNQLVHTLDKLDESRKILTESLVSKWKERSRLGWTSTQLCTELYNEIQRRGPYAFKLLIDGLTGSGHLEIACKLDPTLSIVEEPTEVTHEYYDNGNGDNYVFVNEFWKKDESKSDCEELKNFFRDQGYMTYEEEKVALEDVTSLVVVVFSPYFGGSQEVENDWLHSKFNDPKLSKKPKILISFLYITNVKSYGPVQEESAKHERIRDYEDVLHVKIYIDATKRGSSGVVSEEVRHFISVFSSNNLMHLEEQLLKLQQVYNDNGLHPMTTLDSRFRKWFKVRKNS